MLRYFLIPALLIFLHSRCFSQYPGRIYPGKTFEVNETVKTFGNNVKLRSETHTNSDVLDLIPIGTDVKILEKKDETYLFNGVESPWYKIEYKGKTGYVVGGLLALGVSAIDKQEFFFNFKRNGLTYQILVRTITATGDYTELAVDINTEQIQNHVYTSRGLPGVSNVLFIDYIVEACGVDRGGVYVFYDGQKLIKAMPISTVSEAGLFYYTSSLTFPDDKDGIEGKVIYRTISEETIDESTNHSESTTSTRELTWNGSEFTPSITNH